MINIMFVLDAFHCGWCCRSRRLKPIIVDPGLYDTSKAEMFYATQKRDLPNAFKLFTGFPSVVLSRKLIEHSILGTDNLPRILLMYYANTASSHKNYFQTLLCNTPEFNRTILNHHLHYATWDTPPRQEPRVLGLDDLKNMTESGAAFGTRFSRDDTKVLDRIDLEVLNRRPGNVVPGGWCLGGGSEDPCTVWGNADILRPGPGARNLARAIVQMLSSDGFHSNRCIWDASM
ncbi:putative beta-glucuronosyltransferase GlcAT14A-like [Iris pallida]|uniref:Beta-glucuronosyltransferase GlcAT14A-like n=1 Tax=Iris pallida TaxID=29817 RepID=A0AAX6FYL5_IRIPA|nr:putative beta-glucuronosyltransferase GlcAT14A-like [Iris pallida]